MNKILHLQTELNLTCGVTRNISLIINHSSDIFEHHIICLGGDGLIRFNLLRNQPIILEFDKNSLLGTIEIATFIYKYLKQNSIDIIHAHHRYFDYVVYLISKLLTINTVTSVHSKVYTYKRFSYKSREIIAVSESVKDHLKKEFSIDESRINVIHSFIDPQELHINKDQFIDRSTIGLRADSFIVTFIGRFSKEKGVDILIKAIEKIQLKYQKVTFLMIGEGAEKVHIERFFKDSNMCVRVLPPTKEIFHYYKISDVVVLPSRTDPFPMVMLETGLSNKPFVGSAVDGIDEFIDDGNNGLLVEPENVDALAEAILKLCQDRTFANYIANNLHKKVMENCQVNQVLPKLEKIYSKLCDGF